MKHSATGPKNNHTCKECRIAFSSFYSLRHHKTTLSHSRNYHKWREGGHAKTCGRRDDKSLEEELQSCRHILVDSEKQKERHSVFDFVVNNLTA